MQIDYADFDKVNIYCFDLNQYNSRARKIDCIILANYENELIFSPDIRIQVRDCCVWDGKKWVITDHTEEIKKLGMNHMIDLINQGGNEDEQEYNY